MPTSRSLPRESDIFFVRPELNRQYAVCVLHTEYAGLFTAHFDRESNERSRFNKDKAINK
jgi:hypothetical protein